MLQDGGAHRNQEHEGTEWIIYTDGKATRGVRRFADATGSLCIDEAKDKLYLLETLSLPAR